MKFPAVGNASLQIFIDVLAEEWRAFEETRSAVAALRIKNALNIMQEWVDKGYALYPQS